MAAGQKKVIVRLLAGGVTSGYLPNSGFAAAERVEMMDPGGRANLIVVNEIKWISYVKDFNLADAIDPERMGRKTYPGRPRGEGIWVRISTRDGDLLEGLAPSNAGFVDGMLEDRGIFLIPPEVRSNTQRIYVPRTAIAELEFVAVITTAARRKILDKPVRERQPGLFEDR